MVISLIITAILGGIGSFAVRRSYRRWSLAQSVVEITGEEMARKMLSAAGHEDVQINVIAGTMTDYFDPRDNTLQLSTEVAKGKSIAAHTIACHEAGHYLQHADGYGPLKLRHFLVPIANAASWICWVLLFIGVIFASFGLVWAALILYAASIIVSIVTLPVEFNASKRAIAFLDGEHSVFANLEIPEAEKQGTRDMLRSAALTYVMATIASIIDVICLFIQFGDD